MPYKKILVGTDGSPAANAAVDHASQLAMRNGAELIVVHGARVPLPDHGLTAGVPDPTPILDAGRTILKRVEEAHRGEGTVRCVMRQGDPSEAILEVAEEEGADLIVLGNRGMKGKRRFLLGSVPDRVAHHAVCSVLIVNTTG